MRRINHSLTGRYFFNLVDKVCALFRKLVDNEAVVHNLPANIDWRSKCFQRNLYDVDGAHHSCAKSARFQKQHTLLACGAIRQPKAQDGFSG